MYSQWNILNLIINILFHNTGINYFFKWAALKSKYRDVVLNQNVTLTSLKETRSRLMSDKDIIYKERSIV